MSPFWKGFVKAASDAGLSQYDINCCVKYAAAMQQNMMPPIGGMNQQQPMMPQPQQQPMPVSFNGQVPQANQGQQQMGLPLPLQMASQKSMMPVPPSI